MQPSDTAEKEADSVADHVAESLHGSAKPAGERGADAKERPPAIAAKLDGVGRKIFLARPARDPTTPRQDVRDVPNSVTTQQGVEIQVRPALNHILGAHTVENFDPVTRLGEIGPGTMTSLFPPGFATNAQEVITVVKQALGNKAARNFDPTARQLEVTLKKVKLQIWVGPVGNQMPGVYMLNSCFPVGGIQLTYPEVQRYAQQVQSRTRTIQQVRADLLGRFA